jgi:hypothetical protein
LQGVPVAEANPAHTPCRFEREDGAVVEIKGNEQIEYDGQSHTAATLFEILKEGCCGLFCSRYGSCFEGVWCRCPVRRARASPARQAQMRLMACDKTVPRRTAPV